MKLLRSLFAVPGGPRPFWQVILWWELRRFVYWPFLTMVGFGGLALVAFSMRAPPPGEDEGFEPFLMVMGGFFGANVCYTGGWIAELIARRLWKDKVEYFGPVAFSLGLIFSAAVCLLPPLVFALFSL
jgi:hypothetical protein